MRSGASAMGQARASSIRRGDVLAKGEADEEGGGPEAARLAHEKARSEAVWPGHKGGDVGRGADGQLHVIGVPRAQLVGGGERESDVPSPWCAERHTLRALRTTCFGAPSVRPLRSGTVLPAMGARAVASSMIACRLSCAAGATMEAAGLAGATPLPVLAKEGAPGMGASQTPVTAAHALATEATSLAARSGSPNVAGCAGRENTTFQRRSWYRRMRAAAGRGPCSVLDSSVPTRSRLTLAPSASCGYGRDAVRSASRAPGRRAASYADFRRGGGVDEGGVQRKAVAGGEAQGAQHAQRVVQERGRRRQRRADEAGAQVGKALAGEVLHLARVDVVEEGVDGEVAARRVLLWRANLLRGGVSAALGAAGAGHVRRWGCGSPRRIARSGGSQSRWRCRRCASWPSPGACSAPGWPGCGPRDWPSRPCPGRARARVPRSRSPRCRRARRRCRATPIP